MSLKENAFFNLTCFNEESQSDSRLVQLFYFHFTFTSTYAKFCLQQGGYHKHLYLWGHRKNKDAKV